jgi:predicted AAA+ superfamily ATPase
VPLIAKLTTDEIHTIEKVVTFIGRSPVDGINYSSIAKNVGITKYKAEQYIQLLKKSFILNPIFPFGTNVLKEPKVLMYLPYRLLYKPYEEAKGAIREDFFAEAMAMAGKGFHYLKSRRGMKTPDFLIEGDGEEIIIEVGGKGKGKEQFKGVYAKNKIRLTDSDDVDGNKRPLFLVGYLL